MDRDQMPFYEEGDSNPMAEEGVKGRESGTTTSVTFCSLSLPSSGRRGNLPSITPLWAVTFSLLVAVVGMLNWLIMDIWL